MTQPEPLLRNSVPLSLHIPEPKHRPGDKPGFSGMQIPPAGSVERSDIAVPAKDIRELAYSLIRVLDEKGRAVGPWSLGS